MREAMSLCSRLGRPVLDHALDPVLAAGGILHEGPVSSRLGVRGIPSEAEIEIVKRDIRLSEATGCAVHIQHVSCAGSVTLIRDAQRRGLPVSGEATPHHLALTDEDIRGETTRFKMSPPLRSAADRDALIEAVCEGTLEVLATDHAPHTAASKALGLQNAPFGIVGLETAVTVTYSQLVASKRLSLAEWVRRWTLGPSRILGLACPSLEIGTPANLCLLDLRSDVTVDPAGFQSGSRNTPFGGFRGKGLVLLTLFEGKLTWHNEKLPIDTGNHF
jgi:dihydroorotase